jgi:signal recognition particle receptor subunit beta
VTRCTHAQGASSKVSGLLFGEPRRGTIITVAQVNPLTREVLIKLVYYGPGLGGKTTTLQKVHGASPAETRGKIVSLATPVDRTLYFDFMPLRVGPVHGFPVRLQLFTVPGQVYFNATRKLVLTGADGVVFVADSQRERHDANVESLQNLQSNLEEQARTLGDIPHVLQYNKRDLPNILAMSDLNGALNAHGVPSFESAASRGQGVLEPLDELVRLVLLDLEKRAVFRTEASEKQEIQPPRFESARDGIGESLSRASEELWRDGLDQTLQALKTLPPPHRSAPPPARTMPPASRSAALSGLPTRMPVSAARKQTSEPVRVPRFEARNHDAPVPTTGPSWVAVFPEDQHSLVAQLEEDLVRGDFRSAMLRCDALAAEVLADAAQESGLENEEKRPAIVAMCLGLAGERWRMFRALIQEARLGAEVSEVQALEAYAVVIELNRLRVRSIPPRER